MIRDDELVRILPRLLMLNGNDQALVTALKREASLARIPAGRDVFVEGDEVGAIALLVSGVVRVYKIGETGREITLYRFGLGESCILTANAILSRTAFSAIATVEQDAEAVMIPADTFRTWISTFGVWRDFVFELLSNRLALVMALVDEVAFRRMDIRLGNFLVERSREQHPIRMTHQQIASELGTSREVVSRLLEDMAARGLLLAQRGAIEVLDPESLTD